MAVVVCRGLYLYYTHILTSTYCFNDHAVGITSNAVCTITVCDFGRSPTLLLPLKRGPL